MVKMKNEVIILLSLLIFSIHTPLFAKRAYIDYPDKITVGNIEYKASYDMGKLFQKAYIEARNIETDKIIWRKKIYQIPLNPIIENDIQWVMITKLKYYKDTLIVLNENKETFFLDLKSLKNEKIKTRILKVKIFNENFEEIKILKSPEELEQFALFWNQKKKANGKNAQIENWQYKIDLTTDFSAQSNRWLYNKKGYCKLLSKQIKPVYQIKDTETFNDLILKP